MVSVDKASVVRIEKNGKKFEILVDPDLGFKFRQGQPYGMEKLLAVNEVFRDSRSGDRASASELSDAFGTSDVMKAAELILKNGNMSLTSEQKRKMTGEKRKQIIEIIARNSINPQTNLPHTALRIETVMEQAKVKIDPFKKAEEQVEAILKELRVIIPIRFEKKEVAVKFPPVSAPKAIGSVKHFATIKRQDWLNDGSWAAVVELPAGLITEFFDLCNRLSHGEAQIKLLEKKE